MTNIPTMRHSAARYSRAARESGAGCGAFDAEVRKLGLDPQHQITVEHAVPPDAVADALGLPRGEENALVRRRRLLASDIPVRLNASWFPLSIADGSELAAEGPNIRGGVKSALAELGHAPVEATERIIVRPPTEEEAVALEISPELMVIDIFHVAKTENGQSVEVTTTVTPAPYLVIEHTFPLT
ncbi:UTRA domain-containing protein [Nonomuraea sp. NPDC004702]